MEILSLIFIKNSELNYLWLYVGFFHIFICRFFIFSFVNSFISILRPFFAEILYFNTQFYIIYAQFYIKKVIRGTLMGTPIICRTDKTVGRAVKVMCCCQICVRIIITVSVGVLFSLSIFFSICQFLV